MIFCNRRSLEDPRTSPANWPDDYGILADTGQRIDRKAALKYSPVWRAVALVSASVAKVPCRVFQRNDTGKARATSHPSYQLLRYKPNTEQTAFYFLQTIMGHVLLDPGNGYAYILRDGAGRPTDLILLDPQSTYPVRENGKLYYVYNGNGSVSMRKLDSSEILHFKGPGYDGLIGYSVLEYARNSIAMGSGAQKYSNKYFANNAEPRVVLEFPGMLNDEIIKATRDGWNNMHKGLDKAHSTAILQGDMKAHVLSLSARDSQLIETLDWSIKDVANWFGTPPHKLGDASRTGYNSLEQENQSMLDDTIDPWLVMIEQECRDKLLTEQEKAADSHVIEFDRAALVRANLQARGEYYAKGLAGHPWLLVDEVRNTENLNGVGITDIRPPTNNFGEPAPASPPSKRSLPAPTEPTEPAPDTQRMEDIEALAGTAIADIAARMVKRLRFNFDKALKKGGRASRSAVFATTAEKHDGVIREALSPSMRTLCGITGKDHDAELKTTIADIHAAALKE